MADTKTVVFLGGGRITSALVAGLRLAGDRRRVIVYDRHPEKVRVLRRESQVEIARDLSSAPSQAEMLVIAVRPGSVKEMLDEVVACGTPAPRLCISLAAGIPMRNLRALLPKARWVRAMPSPVCRVGHGLTALCFDDGVTKRDRAGVGRFFARVGKVVEISEEQFDAFTVAYSPSHGYHALATLAQAAQGAGMDRDTALVAAAHALCDGILYWRDGGLSLEELLHEAATPGGIAAATMAAMDKAGYARVVASGISAGVRQAWRNVKG